MSSESSWVCETEAIQLYSCRPLKVLFFSFLCHIGCGQELLFDNFVALIISGSTNEHSIGFNGNSEMVFWLRSTQRTLTISTGDTKADLWTGWHKHCFTWRATNKIEVGQQKLCLKANKNAHLCMECHV